MAMITKRPRNSSLRFQTYLDNSDITKKAPEKGLVFGLRKHGGRNAYGRITVRHRGGGAYQKYRMIDFKRSDRDVVGTVTAVEYDPNRNVRIGLVYYVNGAKKYILLPEGLGVGSTVMAGENVEAKTGNCLPIRSIPVGFQLHNIEMTPGSGGKFARSAGASVQLMAKTDDYATLKMPSGEIEWFQLIVGLLLVCLAMQSIKISIGVKQDVPDIVDWRSSVRGMAMNPVDHPHGGGEGRSKSGSHPMTPWGKGCKGTKTRTRKNPLL